jgi:hypothetical protein
MYLLGILIFKGLTARRLYKSFGVKGLKTRVFMSPVDITYTPTSIKIGQLFQKCEWRDTQKVDIRLTQKPVPLPPFKGRNQTCEGSYITLAAAEVNISRSAGINVGLNYVTYRETYYVVHGTKLLVLQAHPLSVVLRHKRKLQNL